ncbi:MAG: hypothetical protein ACP5F6_03530 [Microbacter sp.]
MKVTCQKEGKNTKVVFHADTIDPSGMSVVGNFNNWDIKHGITFANDSNELSVIVPNDLNEISFKFYDSVYDCWCEVYDNGELYSGLERFFSHNEHGTTNICIPLAEIETKEKKSATSKSTSAKTTVAKTTTNRTQKSSKLSSK